MAVFRNLAMSTTYGHPATDPFSSNSRRFRDISYSVGVRSGEISLLATTRESSNIAQDQHLASRHCGQWLGSPNSPDEGRQASGSGISCGAGGSRCFHLFCDKQPFPLSLEPPVDGWSAPVRDLCLLSPVIAMDLARSICMAEHVFAVHSGSYGSVSGCRLGSDSTHLGRTGISRCGRSAIGYRPKNDPSHLSPDLRTGHSLSLEIGEPLLAGNKLQEPRPDRDGCGMGLVSVRRRRWVWTACS